MLKYYIGQLKTNQQPLLQHQQAPMQNQQSRTEKNRKMIINKNTIVLRNIFLYFFFNIVILKMIFHDIINNIDNTYFVKGKLARVFSSYKT